MKTDQAKPNAHNARTWKLGALTPAQRELLIHWLCDDKITYAAARERVAREFGVRVSNRALSIFWGRYCRAARPAPALMGSDILLDVSIKSAGPVRLVVKKNSISLEY